MIVVAVVTYVLSLTFQWGQRSKLATEKRRWCLRLLQQVFKLGADLLLIRSPFWLMKTNASLISPQFCAHHIWCSHGSIRTCIAPQYSSFLSIHLSFLSLSIFNCVVFNIADWALQMMSWHLRLALCPHSASHRLHRAPASVLFLRKDYVGVV